MNLDLTELVAILEAEIALGEELQRNLEEQKKAVLRWDVVALLERIDGREPRLRSLRELEKKRHEIMKGMNFPCLLTLGELIAKFPLEALDRDCLRRLQEKARRIFIRLQADQRHFNGLMEHLREHLQEALIPIQQASVTLYGDMGMTIPPRSGSGLIHGKA